jgi:hypothetical protein
MATVGAGDYVVRRQGERLKPGESSSVTTVARSVASAEALDYLSPLMLTLS